MFESTTDYMSSTRRLGLSWDPQDEKIPAAKKAKHCCKTGEGTTGHGWRIEFEHIKKDLPINLLIENVFRIKAKLNGVSNLDIVLKDLKSLGYKTVEKDLTPLDIGWPESRMRVFVVASLDLSEAS